MLIHHWAAILKSCDLLWLQRELEVETLALLRSTFTFHTHTTTLEDANSTIPSVKWSHVEHSFCFCPVGSRADSKGEQEQVTRASSGAGLEKPWWGRCTFWKCSLRWWEFKSDSDWVPRSVPGGVLPLTHESIF